MISGKENHKTEKFDTSTEISVIVTPLALVIDRIFDTYKDKVMKYLIVYYDLFQRLFPSCVLHVC